LPCSRNGGDGEIAIVEPDKYRAAGASVLHSRCAARCTDVPDRDPNRHLVACAYGREQGWVGYRYQRAGVQIRGCAKNATAYIEPGGRALDLRSGRKDRFDVGGEERDVARQRHAQAPCRHRGLPVDLNGERAYGDAVDPDRYRDGACRWCIQGTRGQGDGVADLTARRQQCVIYCSARRSGALVPSAGDASLDPCTANLFQQGLDRG
jgi:hypothetical protein